MTTTIAVYADWDGLSQPLRLGHYYLEQNLPQGAAHPHEAIESESTFEFDAAALKHPALADLLLDPGLKWESGRQSPATGPDGFGMFADAGAGEWGRLLIGKRLEREQMPEQASQTVQVQAADMLLGVQDVFRTGALRFRLDDAGDFLDHQGGPPPPFVQLRQLETASLALESNDGGAEVEGDDALRLLIGPGASLGGARPKASVADPSGHLWIAKFPSVHDDYDVGAWEIVVHTLARGCGLHVSESLAKRFSGDYHTFLVRRFDRTETGRRLHFASAMTLTGHGNGNDTAGGASYLEIARVLIDHGAQTATDLRECWSRIVFNTLISNADDHLRNHGFILAPEKDKGWRLSEAYGLNPVPQAIGLTLNINETDNAMDLDLVRSVAHYFRIDAKSADDIIERSRAVVRQWPKIATRLGIPLREREWMRSAFRLAN
jgi:serine/threonine-protein kinase HipA